MQDAKEQPPPAPPEDIIKMSRYKSASDENPRDVFWRLVEAYKEGEKFGELTARYSELREALVNIGCSVLEEEPRGYRVRASKTVIANALFSMVVAGGWKDSLERLLSNLYQRKKGPEVNMLVAFGNAFAKHPAVVGEWLKELLGAERPSEEVLSYILHAGDADMVRFLKAELLNIARTEINEPQVFAMESLGILLPEDGEVGKLFVQMMDDWDEETKGAALNTLKRLELPEAGKKAVSMYPHEVSEEAKMELEEIVVRNKEACREHIRASASKLDGKEKDALCELAKKVYGKAGAQGLVGKEVCPSKRGAKAEPASGEAKAGTGTKRLKLGLMMLAGAQQREKKDAKPRAHKGAARASGKKAPKAKRGAKAASPESGAKGGGAKARGKKKMPAPKRGGAKKAGKKKKR
jgi:hypothetical protein